MIKTNDNKKCMLVMQEQRFLDLKKLMHNVSRETLSDLDAYEQLLCQWHGRINLIAKAAISDIWQRHILDSVQLFPLALQGKGQPKIWLDVGSGGGFPGVVLAIFIKHIGEGAITFIESNGKKAAFLRRVVAQLHLPAHIVNRRIEASYDAIETIPDIVTARALASLPDLLGLIAPFFGVQTLALLPKGRDYSKEVAQAQRDWHFDLVCHPSITDDESAILDIRNLRCKNAL